MWENSASIEVSNSQLIRNFQYLLTCLYVGISKKEQQDAGQPINRCTMYKQMLAWCSMQQLAIMITTVVINMENLRNNLDGVEDYYSEMWMQNIRFIGLNTQSTKIRSQGSPYIHNI